MAKVQDALAVGEEARRKAWAQAARLKVEQTSLLVEIEAAKDEVSSLYSHVGKDKEAMEEEYQKSLEPIFACGYGCYVFKHNIYGDQPEVPDGMPNSSSPLPLEFFMDPRCPLTLTPTKATTTKKAKEPERSTPAGDQSCSLYFFSLNFFFEISVKGPVWPPWYILLWNY